MFFLLSNSNTYYRAFPLNAAYIACCTVVGNTETEFGYKFWNGCIRWPLPHHARSGSWKNDSWLELPSAHLWSLMLIVEVWIFSLLEGNEIRTIHIDCDRLHRDNLLFSGVFGQYLHIRFIKSTDKSLLSCHVSSSFLWFEDISSVIFVNFIYFLGN